MTPPSVAHLRHPPGTSMPKPRSLPRTSRASLPPVAAWLAPLVGASILAVGACGVGPPPSPMRVTTYASAAPSPPPAAPPRTLSIVSINDLHGRIEALPLFAGYVANVRAARAADGGGVLVLDGGDMFQGTLESNLGEGAAVVDGYAPIGFAAAAVGNHEFDFGPVGPSATPTAPGDHPRGALFARAASANFPFLTANLRTRDGGLPLRAENLRGTHTVEVAGAEVGIVGLTTADVLHTTISANVADLEVIPLAEAVQREAAQLRKQGVDLVVVVAHAGGRCAHFTGTVESDECTPGAEAFALARALPPGTIDALVAGHTHAGVAHVVNGVPIIEAFSYGTHLARVDLVLEGQPPRVRKATPIPPRELCPGQPKDPAWASCEPGTYEGRPIERDPRVAAAIAPHLAKAAGKKAEALGVTVDGVVKSAYATESPLGNLVADLLLASRPDAHVALMNGGGLRTDLEPGELTYGQLFQAFPFDNRLGSAKVKVKDLAAILARNLAMKSSMLTIGGATATARCKAGVLEVELRIGGKKLPPDREITILASDFLLTNGDAFWGPGGPPPVDEGTEMMRDVLERELKKRKGIEARRWANEPPRVVMPGARPVRCDGAAAAAEAPTR